LRIGAPQIDTDLLAEAIESGPKQFTRWEARMGNAAVQPDGSVMWFDWEFFGRRVGVEDVAWLLADPYWTLDLAESAALLAEMQTLDSAQGQYLRRMAVLIAANQLRRVFRTLKSDGWPADGAEALRLDRPATDRTTLEQHCTRMAALAGEDKLVMGFGDWFIEASEAMLALKDAA
jgi:hypothetical protein